MASKTVETQIEQLSNPAHRRLARLTIDIHEKRQTRLPKLDDDGFTYRLAGTNQTGEGIWADETPEQIELESLQLTTGGRYYVEYDELKFITSSEMEKRRNARHRRALKELIDAGKKSGNSVKRLEAALATIPSDVSLLYHPKK